MKKHNALNLTFFAYLYFKNRDKPLVYDMSIRKQQSSCDKNFRAAQLKGTLDKAAFDKARAEYESITNQDLENLETTIFIKQ
jgi:hypothetical protein